MKLPLLLQIPTKLLKVRKYYANIIEANGLLTDVDFSMWEEPNTPTLCSPVQPGSAIGQYTTPRGISTVPLGKHSLYAFNYLY